jgi:hypothetical protein
MAKRTYFMEFTNTLCEFKSAKERLIYAKKNKCKDYRTFTGVVASLGDSGNKIFKLTKKKSFKEQI